MHKTKQGSITLDSKIRAVFPSLSTDSYTFVDGDSPAVSLKKVGVVFSGGQASGGHNVIWGILDALYKLDPNAQLIGFLGGPSGIIENRYKELTRALLEPFYNTGGFDLIGSGRTKIETAEQFEKSYQTIKLHHLDALIIIGGDDSNTNAALLAEFLKQKGDRCVVCGVPKTIDGDLKNAHIETSFGFDTAAKLYAELVSNLERDCLSAKKYTHFVKIMGRSASHLALEAALYARPNLTLIAEEIKKDKRTLKSVVDELADLVMARSACGKEYGVIVIPEGLIEAIDELNALMDAKAPQEEILYKSLPEVIQKQLLQERDSHGNIQVSLIETEKLLLLMVQEELKKRGFKGKFSPQCHFFGYEGRAAYPSYFDAVYTYHLGVGALILAKEGLSGYMVCIKHLDKKPKSWALEAIPITQMIHFEKRKGVMKPVIQKALVDLEGYRFQTFKNHRGHDKLEDAYHFCGPSQYRGTEDELYLPPLILKDI